MTNKKDQKLFDPIRLNGIELANRIVMAPMTRARALDNIPNDIMAMYYSQRASAGLIITEANASSPNGLGYARMPGIFNKEQIGGWKNATEAVHKKGGKIFAQIMHVGRIAHSANMPKGSKIIAPSSITADVDIWTDSQGMQKTETPAEMTLAQINQTIEEFVGAAKNAIEAGFDGVEIHAANGYLVEQFLNPHSNKRTDNYGGIHANRCRFVLELTKAVGAAIDTKKLGIRISPFSTFNTMPHYDDIYNTYNYLTKELDKLNVLYLHLVDYAARSHNQGLDLIKTIRTNFGNFFILNGGYNKERVLSALETEGADLVSFASAFISNPDLPFKLANNFELAIPDTNTFYTPGEAGYTDYAFSKS